ncbi:MAG: hypothetical protein AAGJ94_16925 [Pseudomonadota bacterium]
MIATEAPSLTDPRDGAPIDQGTYGPDCFEAVLAEVSPPHDIRRDVMRVMLRDCVVGLDVRAPIAPGPRLYASNHQAASDVVFFSFLIAGLSRQDADIVTWDGYYDLDAAQVNRWLLTHPPEAVRSLTSTIRPRMVNQRDPKDVRGVARAITSKMMSAGSSVSFLCVGGETEQTEGEPMTRMGGVFLDLVLTHQIPITPTRFNWGSSDAREGRNMWTKSLAPQLFVTGETISPQDLMGLSRPAQRALVTDAINALILPRPEGHLAQAQKRYERITWLSRMAGMGLTKAIFCDGLFETPAGQLSPGGRDFVRWASVRGSAEEVSGESWLYRFCRWLSDGFAPARLPLQDRYPGLKDFV